MLTKEVFSMKIFENKTVKHLIFAAGGALVGLIYYKVVGCPSGNCAITSSLSNTMMYTGLMGLWLSWIMDGGCCCSGGSCNIDPKDDKK